MKNDSELIAGERSEKLRFVSLVNLIVANMIGAGVFTTSGFALSDLGSPDRVLAAWLVGGAIALCGALSYGALARALAESGGEYWFLSRALHPLAGFVAGWVSLLAGFTGAIAFAALAFETYVQPLLAWKMPAGFLAVTIIAAAAVFHGVRVGVGVGFQNVLVALKLGLLLIFIAVAAVIGKSSFESDASNSPPPDFSFFAFAASLVWISLSYSGFNAAVYVAGEAERKTVNVPRAMWVGTLIVTAIYLGLNGVFLYLAPFAVTVGREDVAAAAAMFIGGEPLALLVRSIIAVSLLTSVFAMVMTGPRVYARMAEDKLFPQIFRFQGEVPRAAVALQAAAAILLVAVSTLKDLLGYLGFTLSLSAALTVSCVFLLRRREPENLIKIPGHPFVPAFFVGATAILAALAAYRQPAELLAALLTFTSGALLYFALRAWNKSAE